MNGPESSTAPISELALLAGSAAAARPWPASRSAEDGPGDPEREATEPQPDAEILIGEGLVRVHAMFQVDPATKEVHVSVVDDRGRLIRMIPPDSVAQMLAAMASYANRL
jgi:hypothetical protein